MTLIGDIHEPSEFSKYLEGVIPYEVSSLNSRGYADYLWMDAEEKLVQVERKQWGEVLGGLESVEDQLRRHLTTKPECKLIFLLEGMVIGTDTGCDVLRGTSKNNIFITGRGSTIRLTQIYAWLHQIQQYIEVIQTSTYFETCLALAAMYKGDQKKEHSTFQRAYKQVNYHYDPRVTTVMGMFPGIGEVKAEALINKFITPWGIASASPEELATVPGIGKTLSVGILRKLGRTDV